ncbi:MAG: hypothetical protein JHC33_13945 [Ignisphaera sp.]|nr:hypothetical protein [Ignisphaera sp.]
MAILSQSDFIDWKINPVTQAFFEAANIRIDESKELLSVSAGLDTNQDRFLVGMIQAYRELQDFRLEDLDND